MAISAPTFLTPDHANDSVGSQKLAVAEYTLDASYPTGGYAITPNSVGMSAFNFVSAHVSNASTTAYSAIFNPTTNKVQLFTSNGAAPAALAELTAATDVHTVKVRVFALGV